MLNGDKVSEQNVYTQGKHNKQKHMPAGLLLLHQNGMYSVNPHHSTQ